MINVQKIVASTQLFGFRNYLRATATVTIPAQTLSGGGYAVVSALLPLNNTNAVSSVKIQYISVESVWRQAQGSTVTTGGGGSYELESFTYYSGGNLVVDTYVADQTGSANTIPAQTINIVARLYKSPFSS